MAATGEMAEANVRSTLPSGVVTRQVVHVVCRLSGVRHAARSRAHSRGVLLIGILSVPACGESGQYEQPAPPVDAGHSLVTEVPDAERLRLEQPTEIGGPESEALPFHRITHATFMEFKEGVVMVVDEGDARIRLLEKDGRELAAFGGFGFGPGDFRTLSGAMELGRDSILAFDPVARRFTLFRLDSGVVNTFSVAPPSGDSTDLSGYRLAGRLQDGPLVLTPVSVPVSPRPPAEATRYRVARPVLLRDLDGRPVGEIPDGWSMELYGDAWTTIGLPLGATHVSDLKAGTLAVGSTRDGHIRLITRSVDPSTVLRLGWKPASTPPELRDLWIRDRLERIEDRAARRQASEWLQDVPFPQHLPFFTELLIDHAGNVWITRDLPIEGFVRDDPDWVSIAPEGNIVHVLSMPRAFRPTDITPHRVLGIWTDSLGVQSVRFYHRSHASEADEPS